jgi:hypothetical protein
MKVDKDFMVRLQEEEKLIQETREKEVLYFYLIDFFMRKGDGFYSYKELAQSFNTNVESIISAIKIIEEISFINLSYENEGEHITFSEKFKIMESKEVLNDDELVGLEQITDLAKKHFPLLWNQSKWLRNINYETRQLEEKPPYDSRYDD